MTSIVFTGDISFSKYMTEQGAKDLREANDRANLGGWKQARAELVAYIGKDLDFVK